MDSEENVENIQRRKATTRIPVPLEPLPLLPEHLIIKNKKRPPLKTLKSSNQNNASTSSAQVPKKQEKGNKKKVTIKCNLKHVTKRTRNEHWTHNVFEDPNDSLVSKIVSQSNIKLPGPSKKCDKSRPVNENNENNLLRRPSIHNKAFILISDDEDEEEAVELIIKAENDIHLAESRSLTVTPAVPIVHKVVKNVKKSLKRPHSRELQGILTPAKQMIKDDKAKRRLLPYLEDAISTPDYWKKAYMSNQSYIDDIIDYLLKSESGALGVPSVSNELRIIVIDWLMKINGPAGNPAVIQTACWYLDSILVNSAIVPVKLQVIAAACFWIAQKLNGTMMDASKLAAYAKNDFSVQYLLAMEWDVLNELDFPKQPVVPQDFIPYLAWWCDSSHPGEIEVAATFICMCGLLVCRKLCLQCPSVIAVAAVNNALCFLNKTRLQPRLESCHIYRVASEKEKEESTNVTTLLRRAVLAVNSLKNKTLIKQYNFPPNYIAQKIVTAAGLLPDVIA